MMDEDEKKWNIGASFTTAMAMIAKNSRKLGLKNPSLN